MNKRGEYNRQQSNHGTFDIYRPEELIRQLESWVHEAEKRKNNPDFSEELRRLDTIIKMIAELEKIRVPVPPELLSERERLENIICLPKELLTTYSNKLNLLAKGISRLIKDIRRKGPVTKLRVIFQDDGIVIEEDKATDTLLRVIDHIGVDRIAKLKHIRMGGNPIVSERPDGMRAPHELRGYYVETHSSTEEKAKKIRMITDDLRIRLSLEVIPKEDSRNE